MQGILRSRTRNRDWPVSFRSLRSKLLVDYLSVGNLGQKIRKIPCLFNELRHAYSDLDLPRRVLAVFLYRNMIDKLEREISGGRHTSGKATAKEHFLALTGQCGLCSVWILRHRVVLFLTGRHV
jgi:hypothetical protein